MDEQSELFCARLVFIMMGLFCLWYFYSFRTGRSIALHLRSFKGDRWRNGQVIAAPFIGTAMILLMFLGELMALAVTPIWIILFIGLIITGIVFAFWQPDWMKPEWLLWLQQNHSDVIPLLREDLIHNRRGAAFKTWKRKVSTQQGFEAWVEEVRREHGV